MGGKEVGITGSSASVETDRAAEAGLGGILTGRRHERQAC